MTFLPPQATAVSDLTTAKACLADPSVCVKRAEIQSFNHSWCIISRLLVKQISPNFLSYVTISCKQVFIMCHNRELCEFRLSN